MPAQRIMAFAWPSPEPARQILTLIESTGETVKRYDSTVGSFRRIEHAGRWWQHQGVDRATGEHVYLPEVPPVEVDA